MKQRRNSIMRGMSGALGEELVFRQRAGKTVVSLPPISREDDPTDKQQEVRTKFQEATRYAKTALANPDLKAAYKAKSPLGASAYNTAFADYFRAPEILNVDITGYNGIVGDTIHVIATDDFKVKAVQVTILDGAGAILETGAAVADAENDDSWVYTITVSNPDGYLDKVEASDLPGNKTVKDQNL